MVPGDNVPSLSQNKQLAACYRIILAAARKKRLREEKQTTVRGKFGDQTQTAEEWKTSSKGEDQP